MAASHEINCQLRIVIW